MPDSTLTARGQTTVPAAVREALGLRPGDRLRYLLLDGGEVRLLRVAPVSGLAGSLARPDQAAMPPDAEDPALGAAQE